MNKTLPLETIVEQLQEWSERRGLIEKAFECCRVALQNNQQDDKNIGLISRWQLSDIQLHFDKQSLVFNHGILSHPYIDTQIGLYFAAESKRRFRDLDDIGIYRLITSLEGEIEDDYLIFDNGFYL